MKVNHYFDDQVLSLSFDNSNGLKFYRCYGARHLRILDNSK